ncbi:MAG: FHA domain-containing protein [Ardenticatenaceae bacterium]|nr:FHA domain-containing protein [Ardenticatenaceae bacterium]MCB9445103.1 FHA domain-containing protein [Ardenticatenaceae bacterium]
MSAENYQLVVRKGPKPGHVYPLLAPTITIGRDPMSDIVLNDPEVSRYHAQLVETADGYEIHDMGSTNGTYVSGKRIGDTPVLLKAGQDIAFGSGIFLMVEVVGDETNPFEDTPFVEDFEPETAVSDNFSSPVVEPPMPPLANYEKSVPPPAQPLVPSANDEAAQKRKRLITIVVAAIVMLCLCCLLTVVFMYYWGADWILQQLGAQAAVVVQQILA